MAVLSKRSAVQRRRSAASGWRMFIASLCYAFSLAFGTSVQADVPTEIGNRILVAAPTATPAGVGGRSIVRFRIVNEGQSKVVLLGMSTAVAPNAQLVASLGSSHSTVLDSIAIPAGEALDLTTSHIRLEIFPLRRSLVSGDMFPATLNFVDFSVTVSLHVH